MALLSCPGPVCPPDLLLLHRAFGHPLSPLPCTQGPGSLVITLGVRVVNHCREKAGDAVVNLNPSLATAAELR